MENEYFYCYNPQVMQYLRYQMGIKFIIKAINPDSMSVFWLFKQTPELALGLKNYQKQKEYRVQNCTSYS